MTQIEHILHWKQKYIRKIDTPQMFSGIQAMQDCDLWKKEMSTESSLNPPSFLAGDTFVLLCNSSRATVWPSWEGESSSSGCCSDRNLQGSALKERLLHRVEAPEVCVGTQCRAVMKADQCTLGKASSRLSWVSLCRTGN